MSTLAFYAQFVTNKVGVNGLSVTWDVEQITRSDGTRAALVTGGATTITVGRRGLYGYLLANADTKLYDYIATAITATTTVDQQEIAALWTIYEADAVKIAGTTAVVPPTASDNATAAAAAILAAADSDPISANVTYSAGVALSGRLAEAADLPAAAPTAANVADAVWGEILANTETARTLLGLLGTLSLGYVSEAVNVTVSNAENDGLCIETEGSGTSAFGASASCSITICGPGYCNNGLLIRFVFAGPLTVVDTAVLTLGTPYSSDLVCEVCVEVAANAAAPGAYEDLSLRTWTTPTAVSESFVGNLLTIDLAAHIDAVITAEDAISAVNVWLKPTDGDNNTVYMNEGTYPPALAIEGTGQALGNLEPLKRSMRDAMLLAPTPPGTAAAGSVDAKLDDIVEDTGTTLPGLLAALSELDLDTALEGTLTVGEALRVMLAALAGVSAGGGSATITFAAVDGESNRITATVDANGNRTAVTLDGAA